MGNKKYIQCAMDFPVCNHIKGVTKNNKGYATGIFEEGIPFEGELFRYGEGDELQEEISILIPVMQKSENDMECTEYNKTNIVGYEYEVEIKDLSVLTIGMVGQGQEQNENIIRYYVEFLERNGIIRFIGNIQNGSVFYYTDVNANKFAQVHVGLITCGRREAITSLEFRKFNLFSSKQDRSNFKVVK